VGVTVGRRTEIQIALVIVGVIAWGYGQRTENSILQYVGIGFFAVATILRFFKPKSQS
jgi:uncharacterized membrane protein YuzA (DUF378 family)